MREATLAFIFGIALAAIGGYLSYQALADHALGRNDVAWLQSGAGLTIGIVLILLGAGALLFSGVQAIVARRRRLRYRGGRL